MKTIIVVDTLDHEVKLEQRADGRFRVTYGKQVKDHLRYVEAAAEFGECVMHSAACIGVLDKLEGKYYV